MCTLISEHCFQNVQFRERKISLFCCWFFLLKYTHNVFANDCGNSCCCCCCCYFLILWIGIVRRVSLALLFVSIRRVTFVWNFFPYLYRLRCNTAVMDFNVKLTLLPLVVIAVASFDAFAIVAVVAKVNIKVQRLWNTVCCNKKPCTWTQHPPHPVIIF